MTEEIIIPFGELDEKDRILAILMKLGETEEAVAALYRTFAEAWREDREFWRKLAKAEDGHRAYIGHLMVLVGGRPGEFEPVHALTPEMLDGFIEKIRGHASMALNGQLTGKQALYEAHQIENMALESELARLFKSDNEEFLRLSETIVTEEREHRDAIVRLIKERYPK